MLAAGTTLGPYKILAPLGAGGMGEVYRAHDTRLGRDVAIKVLPAHLAATPEVRARFEREARTISQLNHPHICTLYDVGHQEGTDYLVMELLEGETLAHRLEKGPLPVAEVLTLGRQIAEALDRAHRAGVVHRDLKPGNVMLTKGGAKLMDFGLARAQVLGPAAGATDAVADGDPAADGRGDDRRHVPVHGAGAAGGEGRGRAQRHLGAGVRAVRDGDGEAGVRGREPGEPDRGDHEGGAALDDGAAAGDAAGAGAGGAALLGEEPGRSTPIGARPGVRPAVALRGNRKGSRPRRRGPAVATDGKPQDPDARRRRGSGNDRSRSRPCIVEAHVRTCAVLPAPHLPSRHHRPRAFRARRPNRCLRCVLGWQAERGFHAPPGQPRVALAGDHEREAPSGLLAGRTGHTTQPHAPIRLGQRHARASPAGRRGAARHQGGDLRRGLDARWVGPCHRTVRTPTGPTFSCRWGPRLRGKPRSGFFRCGLPRKAERSPTGCREMQAQAAESPRPDWAHPNESSASSTSFARGWPGTRAPVNCGTRRPTLSDRPTSTRSRRAVAVGRSPASPAMPRYKISQRTAASCSR